MKLWLPGSGKLLLLQPLTARQHSFQRAESRVSRYLGSGCLFWPCSMKQEPGSRANSECVCCTFPGIFGQQATEHRARTLPSQSISCRQAGWPLGTALPRTKPNVLLNLATFRWSSLLWESWRETTPRGDCIVIIRTHPTTSFSS